MKILTFSIYQLCLLMLSCYALDDNDTTTFIVSDETTTPAVFVDQPAPANSTLGFEKETWLGILNVTLHMEKTISKLSNSNNSDNILFAPVNILAVLGSLLLGAEGNSRTEILDVLGTASCENITATREGILHSVLGNMLKNFVEEYRNNPSVNVTLAKAVFLQTGIEVQEKFKNESQLIYKNEIEYVDFAASPDNSTDFINQWISKKTSGHIPNLLSSPLSPNTLAVITSALYFNGEWDEPFSDNTTWQYFNTGNDTVLVKMMMNKGTVRVLYDKERKFQVLGLPYKDKNVSMYIILPDEGQDLRKVVDQLTYKDLYQIPQKSVLEQEVTYFVPYMDLKASVDLKSILKNLGLHSIFERSEANLNRIAKDLYVSEAVHNVNLQVTEAGTTGTAASVVVIETRFPHMDTVVVDRPFLFYIYHFPTGSITFWGTIKKPIPFKPKTE